MRSWPRSRSAVDLFGSLLLWACVSHLAWAQPDPAATPPNIPPLVSLSPGQIWSLTGENITRVAIGNPEVADVTVVSENEALVQAKAAGTTNLIVWDASGEHSVSIQVIDRAPEAMEQQLQQLVGQLNLPGVSVKRQDNKLFLVGQVPAQPDLDRLEQMLASYKGVTDLVQVSAPPEAPVSPLLVRLMVQLIELSRTDLEKLGVKWFESVKFTEPEAKGLTGHEALTHWGTLITRGEASSVLNALVTHNKARILAEPKLVTTNDKEASSQLGVDVPILTTTTVGTGSGTTSASVDFRKTGVLLRMTPHIDLKDPDRKIMMSMETEVSSIDNSVGLSIPVGNQTVTVPGFKVRKANTQVSSVSGETVIIAGLLQTDESHNVSQVPALGSFPLFGRLFRSPEKTTNQLELVIAITPELLDDTHVTMEKEVALEQALAVTEVTTTPTDPTLRYALQVQERIAKSLRYPEPEKTSGQPAEVKLRVHLLRDGTLDQALVAESSGFEAFDQAAVRAAKGQSPFPMFPAALVQPDLWLEVPVLFRP